MNLRDKLRAVGGTTANRPAAPNRENRDCRHFAVYRPGTEFPGAWDLTLEATDGDLPVDMPVSRIADSLFVAPAVKLVYPEVDFSFLAVFEQLQQHGFVVGSECVAEVR